MTGVVGLRQSLTGRASSLLAGWLVVLIALLLGSIRTSASPDVSINEFIASNLNGLKDEDAEYSDWIELYIADTNMVTLSGWFLTDSATNLTRWQFPAVTLL